MRIRWTDERIDELRQVMENGHTWRGAARILSDRWGHEVTFGQIENQGHRRGFGPSTLADLSLPDVRKYNDCWQLEGDWLICGDAHMPLTDWEFASQVVQVAKAHGIKRILHAGDLFDFDRYSIYTKILPAAYPEADEEAAAYTMQLWGQWFDEFWFLLGNHDARLIKLLQGNATQSQAENVFKAHITGGYGDERVKVSLYGYATIDTPTGTWRITHPKSYGRNQLSVAVRLAHKHHQHVISYHEHHDAIGFDDSGDYVVINSGMLADSEKMAYVKAVDGTAPVMKQSFVVLKDGRARVIHNHPALA